MQCAPRVYAAATEPRTPQLERWVLLLAAGPDARLAELAACAAHGFADGSYARPVVGVPAWRHPQVAAAFRVRRITFWNDVDVVYVDGMPVLGVRDAILTAARVSSVGRLLGLIQQATYEHRLDVAELIVRRRRGLPGSTRLGAAIEHYLRGQDSAFEVTGFRVLDLAGEAPDHTNVVLVAPDGRRSGPWDQAWEDGRVADLDGRAAHSSAKAQARDAKKDALAAELGLDPARWRYEQVADGAAFVAEVRARREAAASWPVARREQVGRLVITHLPGRGCVCGARPAHAAGP